MVESLRRIALSVGMGEGNYYFYLSSLYCLNCYKNLFLKLKNKKLKLGRIKSGLICLPGALLMICIIIIIIVAFY